MLEWIGVGLLLFLILTFFYKQAINEFRINQANYSLNSTTLAELWRERVPIVIREMPKPKTWTYEDVITRPCYEHLPLFQEKSLVEWLKEASVYGDMICPWQYAQAEKIAMISGFSIWGKKHLQPIVENGALLKWGRGWWNHVNYYAWAGNRGLHRTYAIWTCILPVEEEIVVTIFPERMESYLPAEWRGAFPEFWTRRDTPFVDEIKYMDIVVRPETMLCLPPHWFVSWRRKESKTKCRIPMVYTIAYHSPISLFAFHMARSERWDRREDERREKKEERKEIESGPLNLRGDHVE